MAEAIHNALMTAERFPGCGRASVRFKGCRELVLYSYLIVYKEKPKAVEVIAIVHGARK